MSKFDISKFTPGSAGRWLCLVNAVVVCYLAKRCVSTLVGKVHATPAQENVSLKNLDVNLREISKILENTWRAVWQLTLVS